MNHLIRLFCFSFALSSCSHLMDPALSSQTAVSQAKSVAICQSPSLNHVVSTADQGLSSILSLKRRAISLPDNSTAKAIAMALPEGIKPVLMEGMQRPRTPANRAAKPFRSAWDPSFYPSVKPVQGCDLIIYVCETMTTRSMGYYNPAAAVYVPGAEGRSGYLADFNPIIQGCIYGSFLDVYVYSGHDGRCLGSFYLNFAKPGQHRNSELALQEHLTLTGKRIVQKVFGRSN